MHFSRSDATRIGIWLVFLVFSFVPFVFSDLGTAQLLFIGGCIAGFALVYAIGAGYWASVPPQRLPVVLLIWCAVLLLAPALLVPLIGWYVIIFFPYFIAILLYGFGGRAGYIAVGLSTTTTVILLATFQPREAYILASIAISTPIFMLITKAIADRESAQQTADNRARLAHEREEIASDVHDLLGQSLTVINLKSELAQRQVRSAPEKALEELRAIAELSRASLDEVRATVTKLRQPSLSVELASADAALRAANIAARLPDPAQSHATAGDNQELFAWAVREAVTNIVRHSQARRVWIDVHPNQLAVSDDGIGGPIAPGHGLSGLRSRVEGAGGRLAISSRTGRGTLIEVIME